MVQWINLSEQQLCGCALISFVVKKNWTYLPTASGSYGRLADKIWVDFKILQVKLLRQ